MEQTLITHAADMLRQNDLGTCTVPTHGLFPFQ